MAHNIVLNTAGIDQPPARAAASTSLARPQITYYVARTLVLATGDRLADVPVSRRVTSVGIAKRLLKRACRRAGDAYLVRAWSREHHSTASVGAAIAFSHS